MIVVNIVQCTAFGRSMFNTMDFQLVKNLRSSTHNKFWNSLLVFFSHLFQFWICRLQFSLSVSLRSQVCLSVQIYCTLFDSKTTKWKLSLIFILIWSNHQLDQWNKFYLQTTQHNETMENSNTTSHSTSSRTWTEMVKLCSHLIDSPVQLKWFFVNRCQLDCCKLESNRWDFDIATIWNKIKLNFGGLSFPNIRITSKFTMVRCWCFCFIQCSFSLFNWKSFSVNFDIWLYKSLDVLFLFWNCGFILCKLAKFVPFVQIQEHENFVLFKVLSRPLKIQYLDKSKSYFFVCRPAYVHIICALCTWRMGYLGSISIC